MSVIFGPPIGGVVYSGTFIMQDLLYGPGSSQASPKGGVCGKLAYRQDIEAIGGLQALADSILELSRNYRFAGLEKTGPVVSLIPGQSTYPTSYFTNGATDIVNLIPSFYMNFNAPGYMQGNANYFGGTPLTWKSVDSLELMLNSTYGNPSYFTRYGDKIIIAPTPNAANTGYLRYQTEHPFTSPSVSLSDVFLLPNEWREIVEYATALRLATNTRMLDVANQYHGILFGDPQGRGDVGLIARRITQIEGDSTSNTSMRSIKVRVSR